MLISLNEIIEEYLIKNDGCLQNFIEINDDNVGYFS